MLPPTDRSHFANTVLWLEDQKIRQYKIEDREPLRAIDVPNLDWEPAWNKFYQKYQMDVRMPTAILTTPAEEISWLLTYAVRLEYTDNCEWFPRVFLPRQCDETRVIFVFRQVTTTKM